MLERVRITNEPPPSQPSAQAQESDALSRIRIATEECHRRTEVTLGFLMAPSLRPSDLKWLFKRLYTFYTSQEARLLATLEQFQDSVLQDIDYRDRLRVPALFNDLAFLGVSPSELASEPPCIRLPELNTPAQRLGYLYVIEGSSLGGRTINNHLQKTLGIDWAQSLKYFSIYGAEIGLRWKTFMGTLTGFCKAHPEDVSSICEAAKDTFEKLGIGLKDPRMNRATQQYGFFYDS